MSKSNYFEHLQFIPYEDEEDDYTIVKEYFYDELVFLKKTSPKWTARNCVNRLLHDSDHWMDQNGMEKATYIIASMLFQMELNEVDEQLAYEAYCDVSDLETGNYDHLFSEKDLKLLKADMKTIRSYLNQHPALCEL